MLGDRGHELAEQGRIALDQLPPRLARPLGHAGGDHHQVGIAALLGHGSGPQVGAGQERQAMAQVHHLPLQPVMGYIHQHQLLLAAPMQDRDGAGHAHGAAAHDHDFATGEGAPPRLGAGGKEQVAEGGG